MTTTKINTTNSTTTTAAYRIKADYCYFSGTINSPQNGYLMDEPQYDSFVGRETQAPLDFASIEEAFEYLTSEHDGYTRGTGCEYDGKGIFSSAGIYVTAHGQHSRPFYSIVNRKSGKSSKEIVNVCGQIMATKIAL